MVEYLDNATIEALDHAVRLRMARGREPMLDAGRRAPLIEEMLSEASRPFVLNRSVNRLPLPVKILVILMGAAFIKLGLEPEYERLTHDRSAGV